MKTVKLRRQIWALLLVPALICCAAGLAEEKALRYDSDWPSIKAAAEGGDVKAQYWAGLRLFSGDDETPMDLPLAAQWLRKAVEGDSADAQALLGYMYVTACGIPADLKQGFALVRQAAAVTNSTACFYLGGFYEMGRGELEPDRFEAMDWYMKAAAQGSKMAKDDLRQLRRTADDARAGRLTNEWWNIPFQEIQQQAEQGDAEAQRHLGLRYKGYGGTPIDFDQSRMWLEKSAAQGNLKAEYSLAQLYVYTENVDPEKAFYHCLRAAEGGDSTAQRTLGGYYRDGFGTAIDRVAALRWFLRAQQGGHSKAGKSIQSLIKGTATISNKNKNAREADDYSPPTVELTIRDVDNQERSVTVLKYDPVEDEVQLDYPFGEYTALPLAAFDATAVACIKEAEIEPAFRQKTSLRVDTKTLSKKDLEAKGCVEGLNSGVNWCYQTAVYQVRVKNYSSVQLDRLRVEYRLYSKESRFWRHPVQKATTSNHVESASFSISLAPGEEYRMDPIETILASYHLTGWDYYENGDPSSLTRELQGIRVRVYRNTPDGGSVYLERCEPPDLASQVRWKP